MSIKNFFSHLVVFLVGIFLILSCKMPNTTNYSNTKSLDNFSSKDKLSFNFCTADQPDILMETSEIRAQKIINIQNKWLVNNVAISEDKANLKNVIKDVLSAVPYINLIYFFDVAHGTIYVDNKLDACSKSQNTSKLFRENKSADILSCWFLQTNQATKEQLNIKAQVYVLAQEYALRHSLIRSLAFVQSLFLKPEIIQRILEENPLKEYLPYTHIHFLENLEQAYWEDIKNNKPESLQYLLQKKSELEKESGSFQDIIFAEAFDSYYCSSKTHHNFKIHFPNTYNAFNGHIRQ